MKSRKPLYHRHRFPQDIIRHTVWLYYRFCISYRDVEDLYELRNRCRQLRILSGGEGGKNFISEEIRGSLKLFYYLALRELHALGCSEKSG